ncbi:MAG: metal-dependent hydrolase [Acidobacteriia bacterium]|nr:metal-dependent hydrolase [Terriglobia bacterium]
MENLTHTLVGVLLARAGLDRWTPRATALCVVAANLPDIDIVTAGSSINYLTYHRHITHSLPAVPVMAALTVLIVEGVHRVVRRGGDRIRWRPAFAVSLIATLSHAALDMTNAYGTRLWLPFDGRWSSWDLLFIVDLWVWAILLAPLLILFAQRVIRRRAGPGYAPKLAWAGLAILVAYIGFRAVLHNRVITDLNEGMYAGGPPVRVAAFPLPLEIFRWSAFVETERFFLTRISDARRSSASQKWRCIDKAEETVMLQKARSGPVAQQYLDFAAYARAEVTPLPTGHRIQFSDFRFRRGEAAGFLCTVELGHDHNIINEEFRFWGGSGLFSFSQRLLPSLFSANTDPE